MNPIVNDTLRSLAGVSNAERIDKAIKDEADKLIKKLFEIIQVDADKMLKERSTIIL